MYLFVILKYILENYIFLYYAYVIKEDSLHIYYKAYRVRWERVVSFSNNLNNTGHKTGLTQPPVSTRLCPLPAL